MRVEGWRTILGMELLWNFRNGFRKDFRRGRIFKMRCWDGMGGRVWNNGIIFVARDQFGGKKL